MSIHSLKERELIKVLMRLSKTYKDFESNYHTLIREAVKAMLAALLVKDPVTYGHSTRVSRYALILGHALELSEKELIQLELGALLHDIGKIGIPDHILLKPGGLTPEEYEVMKTHALKSADILLAIDPMKEIVPIVKYHQERVDGKGYPDGLQGEEIPLFSRIVYIADAFDAMTSDRPYRKAMSQEEAFRELENFSGKQYDAHLVKLFVEAYQKNKKLPKSLLFLEESRRKAVGE